MTQKERKMLQKEKKMHIGDERLSWSGKSGSSARGAIERETIKREANGSTLPVYGSGRYSCGCMGLASRARKAYNLEETL